MQMMGSRQLLGSEVFSQDGHHVGEVQGLKVDLETWRIRYLEVRLDQKVLASLNLKKLVFGSQSVRIACNRILGLSAKVILRDDLAHLQFVEADE
jgi:sporulation protein YlmC with PRC-barrel domain|tara:strand:+ start:114 stop:398 length:285 start_codon:yes stop_codon:yes gene_type:complete